MARSPAIRLQLAVKRAIDLVASALLLIILSPLMALIALAVRRTSPGGAVFRQPRAGKDGRPFTVYKFRTLRADPADAGRSTRLEAGDPRITRIGALLRRTSLDELPQLLNVLRGEMSLIGPRPDLPHHVERYTPFQRRRLAVRPGITGWAQVSGRNSLSWDERIRLDVAYIEGWSLARDVDVAIRTLGVVLTGRGVAGGGRTEPSGAPPGAASLGTDPSGGRTDAAWNSARDAR